MLKNLCVLILLGGLFQLGLTLAECIAQGMTALEARADVASLLANGLLVGVTCVWLLR
jgi:hypothetical protein